MFDIDIIIFVDLLLETLYDYVLKWMLSRERLDREGHDGLYVGQHIAHRREAGYIIGRTPDIRLI